MKTVLVVLTAFACSIAHAQSAQSAQPDDSEPAWPAPMELATPQLPTSVDEALGIENASALRKLGIGGVVTGTLLAVVSAGAFTVGLDAERALRAEPHPRDTVDATLFQRSLAAAVAWPSLVLAVIGVGTGVGLLVVDDAWHGGLSDGHEEVTP